MNTAIIIGFIILGVCLIGCSFILSGAVTGAAAALKNTDTQMLQQPTMNFLTEFDAADYLGLSLNELDYMRSEGLLENTFIAVTSLEQTGDEEYSTYEDGVQVTKVRPVVSPVTRFLYNTQLLDKRMLELIKDGQHINPASRKRQKGQEKPLVKPEKVQKPKEKPVPEKEYIPDDENITDKLADTEEEDLTSSFPVKTEEPAADNFEPEERPVKPSKKSSSKNSSGQKNKQSGGNKNRGSSGRPGEGGKAVAHAQSVKKTVSSVSGEDDSDMKIVGVKSKNSKTVYSEKKPSNPSSPVYSSSDSDDVYDIPIIKPSQKSISRPRIAVISSDDDDNI